MMPANIPTSIGQLEERELHATIYGSFVMDMEMGIVSACDFPFNDPLYKHAC